MTLESDLFKNSDSLKACEIKDSAHIVADEPPNRRGVNNRGPHIALIQKALRRLMSSPKFGLEEANEEYGPKTAEVVRQFKLGPPMILNTELRQTTPDNIVGRRTIKALDTALVRQKGREIPPNDLPIPPLDPFGPFQVVVFNEKDSFPISRQDHNRNEDDLDNTRREPINLTKPLPLLAQGLLLKARTMEASELQLAMKIELGGAGRGLGLDMANRFFNNQAVQDKFFPPNDKITQALVASDSFKRQLQDLESQISNVLQAGIRTRKVCDYHDLAVAKKSVQFELPSFPFTAEEMNLKAVIGGMKGGFVSLKEFDANADTRRWRATLSFLLVDHFGINDEDLRPGGGHGTFGQVSMWVLQHEHRPGNCPFISKFVFDAPASGPL
ncbi:peptidoglycan-binding domain-containing protein [Anatilimnocola floriformis]|uniref:peptidoglycan-binding domain-containing protein n=1 Tax=Anatilimnocola floriformis TaxID=2948575 RepID=UPI0020C1FE24|nr:hypothetical protein [Anatilimnocola floriformis]